MPRNYLPSIESGNVPFSQDPTLQRKPGFLEQIRNVAGELVAPQAEDVLTPEGKPKGRGVDALLNLISTGLMAGATAVPILGPLAVLFSAGGTQRGERRIFEQMRMAKKEAEQEAFGREIAKLGVQGEQVKDVERIRGGIDTLTTLLTQQGAAGIAQDKNMLEILKMLEEQRKQHHAKVKDFMGSMTDIFKNLDTGLFVTQIPSEMRKQVQFITGSLNELHGIPAEVSTTLEKLPIKYQQQFYTKVRGIDPLERPDVKQLRVEKIFLEILPPELREKYLQLTGGNR